MRHWRAAQASLKTQLRYRLTRLSRQLEELADKVAAPVVPVAPPRDILGDLVALSDEFEDVHWDQRQHALAVTTAAITLEERYLGPFRVDLSLREMLPYPTYKIVALDPQPASANRNVTHPHVQSGRLCEGAGTMALRAALRDGRLLDFFVIVHNLLTTYNSSSPFVSLDDWDGQRCSECDCSLSEDEECSCACGDACLCSDCVRSCTSCGESLCSSCSCDCSGCRLDVCSACTQWCSACDEEFCGSCLNEQQRCHTCHEAEISNSEDERADAATAL